MCGSTNGVSGGSISDQRGRGTGAIECLFKIKILMI